MKNEKWKMINGKSVLTTNNSLLTPLKQTTPKSSSPPRAAARIPDDLILKTNLIGTEDMVRERLRTHRHAGVNTLQVNPDGQSLDERLATLARLVELVQEIDAEP